MLLAFVVEQSHSMQTLSRLAYCQEQLIANICAYRLLMLSLGQALARVILEAVMRSITARLRDAISLRKSGAAKVRPPSIRLLGRLARTGGHESLHSLILPQATT